MVKMYGKKSCESCKAARAFLADHKLAFEERDFFSQRFSPGEIQALGKKLGDIRELVALRRRDELQKLSPSKLAAHLATNPEHLRRPIIDVDGKILAGFNAKVRGELEAAH